MTRKFHKDDGSGHWDLEVDSDSHTAVLKLNGKSLDPHPGSEPTPEQIREQGFTEKQ